jgi:superoxide reductase
MTKRNEIYKCSVCGNIVEVLHEGDGELVCCGKPMDLMEEKNDEEGKTEKHKPVIDGNTVKVGSVPHPMEEVHYIEWIEATGKNGEICKIFLKPGDSPEAKFEFNVESARAYCNVHGLWT